MNIFMISEMTKTKFMKLLQIQFTKFYHCWVGQVWNQEGTFYGSLGNNKRFNVAKR